jgi:hypothetical protein
MDEYSLGSEGMDQAAVPVKVKSLLDFVLLSRGFKKQKKTCIITSIFCEMHPHFVIKALELYA